MVMRVFGIPAGQLTNWSVQEDGVSLDRDQASGGFSEYSLEGAGGIEPALVVNKDVVLSDLRFGRTHAVARALTTGPWSWSVTLNDPFYLLDIETTIEPMVYTELKTIIAKFFRFAGVIDVPKIYVQNFHPSSTVSGFFTIEGVSYDHIYDFPGGKGNLWSLLKSWLSANDLQITWIYDTVVVFKNHTVLTRLQGYTSDYKISYEQSEPVSSIECTYRESLVEKLFNSGNSEAAYWVNGKPVFSAYLKNMPAPTVVLYPYYDPDKPFVEALKDLEVLSVDAGETKEFVLEVPVHVKSITSQPVCVMPSDYPSGARSVYFAKSGAADNSKEFGKSYYVVVGKDNKPITPAQWNAEGGSVFVEVGDEPNQIKVTVTGMLNKRLAPYRLAESDGQNDYSFLRICGEGYPYVEKTVTFYTGYARRTDPLKISSPYIDTVDKAYAACVYAAQSALGTKTSLEWSGMTPLNEAYTDVTYGFEREPVTAADVTAFTDAPLPEKAREKWPEGTSMKKIMDDLLAFTANKPVTDKPQVFGRMAGTCALFDRAVWQINSVEYSESGANVSAEPYTSVRDLADLFDMPRVSDLPTPPGITLGQLSLRGFEHREAQSA